MRHYEEDECNGGLITKIDKSANLLEGLYEVISMVRSSWSSERAVAPVGPGMLVGLKQGRQLNGHSRVLEEVGGIKGKDQLEAPFRMEEFQQSIVCRAV